MVNDSTNRLSSDKKFTLAKVTHCGRLQGSSVTIQASAEDRGKSKMEPRQDLLRNALESYLNQSRLSLSALAGKLNVS
ncbi:MAG: hypothetical protein KDD43_09935, partial [Bdellovibrionales bacterium]|nr:hypothetical protein [Bdellovibrionales bacterium]